MEMMQMEIEYYSFSRLSTYQKCPRAFEYRYIDDAEPGFESTIEQLVGSCVHKAIELASLNAGSPLGDILKWYQDAWDDADPYDAEVVRDDMDVDDYFEEGKEFLDYFYYDIYGEGDGTTLALEKHFTIELGDGSTYKGVIDRVARMDDGTVLLIDYKTGKRVPDPDEDLQLQSYALFGLAEYDDSWVDICYVDLRKQRRLTTTVFASDKKRIDDALTDIILDIETDSCFEAKPSRLCRWCSYKNSCPDAEG